MPPYTTATGVSEPQTPASTLTPEARLRVNAAIGWLGHVVAGRTTLAEATDAVAKLLAAAADFQP